MNLVPWRKVENWFCIACGECCREFKVPLKVYEAVRLANIFGYKFLELGLGGYVLRKRADGRCVFQFHSNGKWICGIQRIKPLACKLWPFLISERPRDDSKEEAEYEFRGYTFYVYVNSFCKGIVYGRPSYVFANKVVPEFIELSLGLREEQTFSTSLLLTHKVESRSIRPLNILMPHQSLLAQNQSRVWCLQL
ncbi:MAG: YkgJ family cysteine cluster protein [Candidatus Nezhaarchaeota archaeon]|nr:YkgJ family cysteine cluster protein [Candidatus Nezhaarchaeota archaeon]